MNIRETRKRLRFTQADLAKRLGTTQQTIARWESGKTALTVSQLQALAGALECTVFDLLGEAMPAGEGRAAPSVAIRPDAPFGTLRLGVGGAEVRYPIDGAAVSNLGQQLAELGVGRGGQNGRSWLIARTLDNKVLFINPFHVDDLEMISDDIEEMPDFAHPEVYRALRTWGDEDIEPALAARCRDLIGDREAFDVQLQAAQMVVRMGDGAEHRPVLSDEVAAAFRSLERNAADVPENAFLMISEEGLYRTRYVNLERVALVELPAEEYLRLNAPPEA